MPGQSELSKGYFPVQTRVSKGRNPALYEHLTRESQNGESPGAVLRRLAEEALMLRNHPLTRALQAIDFKGDSRDTFLTAPQGSVEQKREPFHTSTPPVSTPAPAKDAPKAPPKAPVSGAQQMASILVQRTAAGAPPRG